MVPLDLSSSNANLQVVGIQNYIANTLNPEEIGYGGYLEHRTFYLDSPLFQENTRTLHIGLDLWAPAGTPVYAPYDSIVHSFANNANYLDYGPTIILQHQPDFFTLHGHLSHQSLQGLSVGKSIKRGELFATFGAQEENGNWPPHLHLQCIRDMQGKRGDFPGVVMPVQKDDYTRLCPNPLPLIGLS